MTPIPGRSPPVPQATAIRGAVDAPAVLARGLTRRYGERLAVDALDLEVAAGEFLGVLGPNGSGKTTTLHMLSTLIRPTRGRAQVAGHDVHLEPVRVRRAIGVVFQESALDRTLSARENLRFAGRLYDLPAAELRRRSDELLELFGLRERAHEPVLRLSGGMRRALDIARGVMHRPRILFLDEPTIGLDLPGRQAIWSYLGRLRRETGMTVLLTTHYLEEAVACDRVAFMRRGRLVAEGAPRALIERLASHILEIEGADLAQLEARLARRFGRPLNDGERLYFRFDGGSAGLAMLQAELGGAATALRLRRPNLNDVFLWLHETGAIRKAS